MKIVMIILITAMLCSCDDVNRDFGDEIRLSEITDEVCYRATLCNSGITPNRCYEGVHMTLGFDDCPEPDQYAARECMDALEVVQCGDDGFYGVALPWVEECLGVCR